METNGISRRSFTAAALAVAAAAPFGTAGFAGPAVAAPARLRLPRPTGPYPIGTVPLLFADRSRAEPRELMVSLWYPAADVRRHPPAPWMLPNPLRDLLASAGFAPDAALSPSTAGHTGAPVLRGRFPVVLYSHGAHDQRADTTITVQELASHGYVVATVDHTGDAFVEFPDGRLLVPSDDLPMGPADFAADIRFVLDRLEERCAERALPAGLGGALDLRRVGMFGWSKGGSATARVMFADRRVRAGVSLDGPMEPVVDGGVLDRPFLMMTAEFTRADHPAVAEFWSQLRGRRLNVQADGAVHGSYTDYQLLVAELAPAIGMSEAELAGWIGTLDPARAVRIQQAYPLAFFDRHLRGRRSRLLDGPSAAFPEVRYLP
ncbi:acetylhydrolase [Actinoplanes sp. KI2]|uniref:alpha/beta hydrolase family protein n=1 Tax=Actinoplanes sp. KI2 TaxID=2983315 RepID=UPI0021D57005|nr:acetylhydrolase [Actinoplanes sp. KI2]MCU7729760.1 acetylhydrolase [Actinoplanes sp. KI2]